MRLATLTTPPDAIRVFPYRTNWTPTDEFAFIGEPPFLSNRFASLDKSHRRLRAMMIAKPIITTPEIIEAVEKYYRIGIGRIRGRYRWLSVSHARQIAMYLARTHTNYSLTQIGEGMGHRDHTTILHGVRAVERRMLADEELRKQIGFLEEILKVKEPCDAQTAVSQSCVTKTSESEPSTQGPQGTACDAGVSAHAALGLRPTSGSTRGTLSGSKKGLNARV